MSSDKERIDLLERENALLAEKVRLLREYKELEREADPEDVASIKRKTPAGASENPAPRKRSRKAVVKLAGNKKIEVTNPDTGKRITIGGNKSRAFKRLVAAAEKDGWKIGRNATNNLINVLVQAQRQGVTQWSEDFIPRKVQKAAAKQSGVDTPWSSSSSSSDTDSEGVEKLEDFAGKFQRYHIKMTHLRGKNILEDLTAIKDKIEGQLKTIFVNVFNKRAFKMYLEYEFLMERGAYVDPEGHQDSAQEQLFKVSSADKDKYTQVIRNIQNCDSQLSQAMTAIMELYTNLANQGSGWRWKRSIGLSINVSRKVDSVPIRGQGADTAIRRNEEEDNTSHPSSDEREESEADEHGDKEKHPEDVEGPSTGGEYLPLPKWLRDKRQQAHCIFNPHPMTGKREDDDHCFSWAILRGLNMLGVVDPANPMGQPYEGYDRYNTRYQPHRKEDNNHGGRGYKSMGNVGDLAAGIEDGLISHIRLPDGVQYPVPLKDKVFEEVERLNGISLSVFLIDSKDGPYSISPFYTSHTQETFGQNERGKKPHIRLGLLISQKPKLVNRSVCGSFNDLLYNAHFVLIHDLVGLCGAVNAKRGHNSKKTTFYCDNCLNRFSRMEGLNGLKEHREACLYNKPTKLTLPYKEKAFIKFNNFRFLELHPFVIYADLEAVNAPKEEAVEIGSTKVIADHKVSAWAYQIIVSERYRDIFSDLKGAQEKNFQDIRSYCGEGAMDLFFNCLMEDADVMHSIVMGPRGDVEMEEMSDEKYKETLNAPTDCYFCRTPLPKPKTADAVADGEDPAEDLMSARVMHHDHFTGKVMGVAHSRCNIGASLKKKYFVPVIFHNLKGYDGYHIIRSSGDWGKVSSINVVAKSLEKFTSFNLNKKVRFIDSLQFLQASLDTLVRNLDNSVPKMEDKLKIFNPVIQWERYPEQDTEAAFKQLVKKGVYPYELARNVNELYEITQLPSKEEFYSRLRGKTVSDGEYRRAQWAWDTFACTSLATYTMAYCELDVLLLACVFEEFRKAMMASHRLDPVHFVTLPSVSWQAMLLHNMQEGTVIECVSDDNVGIDGMLMIKKGIRGGICQVMNPHAMSNVLPIKEAEQQHKPKRDKGKEKLIETEAQREKLQERSAEDDLPPLVIEDDDDDEEMEFGSFEEYQRYVTEHELTPISEEVFVGYDDKNNLYGEGMSHYLPRGNFRWEKELSSKEVTTEERKEAMRAIEDTHACGLFQEMTEKDKSEMEQHLHWLNPDMYEMSNWIQSLPDEGEKGWLLEVDLDYPPYLHDAHNDLPFCPENKLPPNPSDFSKQQYGRYEGLNAFKTPKLILDLSNKKEYVIHFRMLKLALKHGLILRKIHRVISFDQSPWLRSYIDLNTALRSKAKNAVEKDMFKLLNNSIFGKCIEDVMSRRNVEFFYKDQWERAVKHASHPWMKGWRIIVPEKLIAIEKAKPSICLDRPIAVGQAILDLSKVSMYTTWYEQMKPHFALPGNPQMDNRLSLLYIDTDSFIYAFAGLKGKSVWRDLYELYKKYDCFDFSEMQYKAGTDDPRFECPILSYEFDGPGTALAPEMGKNAKKLGKMKMEMKGLVITEFVGLRPKMYSLQLQHPMVTPHHNLRKKAKGKTELKAEVAKKKGLPRSHPEEDRLFSHQAYKNVYLGGPSERITFPSINKTKTLSLYTGITTKAGLTPLDDKSYWMNAAVCLRYGHYFIETFEKASLEEALHDAITFHERQDEKEANQREVERLMKELEMETNVYLSDIVADYPQYEEYFVSDDHYVEPLVWPFGESRPEVTVLHLREKKGNRKARRLTKEDGCYVLKWQLDSTLFIGEIFAIILDYLMDEFISVERMIQVFDSMCTVHAVLSQPRDPKDLRSGVEKLGTDSEPKVLSFLHYGAKASYFRCLTAGYLRQRYTPFIKSRNQDVWPERLNQAEWWVNDRSFLELLFRSRSFCVDCFNYLPLHVYERPAGPGTQVWQPPLRNDEDYKNEGSSNPPRIESVSQMLRNPTALFNHLLGNSNDFMQYDPLWRGEPSYEELLHDATFIPSYLGGDANAPLENMIKQRFVCAFERNRQQTDYPVAPPRCFCCLNKRYPMMDIPSAWGLLTETITNAFSEEPGETEDKGLTDLCATLMDVLPDDMLYTLKSTGRSQKGKKSTAPSDRMCQAACLVPPDNRTYKKFAKKDKQRTTLQDALVRSKEDGFPGQDFDSVNSGSFSMGVFNSCVTNIMPPLESLEWYLDGQTSDFHRTVTEITESFLWHVNKKHGPTVDPWNPPSTQTSYIQSSVHSCSSVIKHYSFKPKNGDANLFESAADYGGDDQPVAFGSLRSIPEESESLFTTEQDKLAAYEENHPPLAWPFCDHHSMRSNGGVILQYVLLKLLCLLPYKRMVAPRSVHKRCGFGNALIGKRKGGNSIGGPEPPFIDFFNHTAGNSRSLRDENNPAFTKAARTTYNKNMTKTGMDALFASSLLTSTGRKQPRGWERLGWFFRLNEDVDPTSRSCTRLKLLRGCPASYAESDVHMDRLSFMPPAQLCHIMGLKQVVSTLKRQLEESRPKFKVPKSSPAFYNPSMSYMFTGADWARYDKDCRQKGKTLGGDSVPACRSSQQMNKIGEVLSGKELPVIQQADVLLLARLFIDFIREFRSDPDTMSWATFEKKVSKAFFNMWMGVDRVPCSAISVTKNGYPHTFLSQFHSDGIWRYGDDIRHRLWYGCIGIFNPFEENLNSVDAYVYSRKAACRARKIDNGLRVDTFDMGTSKEKERHFMMFCNKYTKIGICPMRRCLGNFRLSSTPGREYEDNRLVTIHQGANVYQMKLNGNEEGEVGMEEAVPINSKLTKECNAYVSWYKRDVTMNHFSAGRNVKIFWNTEFEDAEEEKKEEPFPEAFETPDKGQLKRIATPDAPVRPSSAQSLLDEWTTPKKTKKRKSWQRVQDRIGKQWMKKKKLEEATTEIWIEDEEKEEEEKNKG